MLESRPMTSNFPAVAQIYADLSSLVEKLKALDASTIESNNLVYMVNAVKDVGTYANAIHAQIEARAIGNNELIPGVVVKNAIVHRKWTDPETAAELAREQLGNKAFTKPELISPAQMEKLGEMGKAFVALASFKPEAGKKVVY
jgi:hypothetical protein